MSDNYLTAAAGWCAPAEFAASLAAEPRVRFSDYVPDEDQDDDDGRPASRCDCAHCVPRPPEEESPE